MKRIFWFFVVIVLILAVPLTVFAASNDDLVEPTDVTPYKASISLYDTSTALISATTSNSTPKALVATAQLQRKVNGSWVNYGTSVTNSKIGTTVTATKRITIINGYSYRVKATHKVGTTTATTYSGSIAF